MEVLESLAPVPSEEVVAIKPQGEGIERFRRRVEPASGSSSLPDLPPPQENSSIFSQRQFSDSVAMPPSGEGEWDSGHASSSKTKKSEIAGEDASGSGEASGAEEQDKPLVLKPEVPAPASTAGSAEESSGIPSTVSAAATESLSPLSQPPPIAISQNSVDKETASSTSTASFNAAEPEVADKALSQTNNISNKVVPAMETEAVPAASGSGEGAHPLPSADTKQETSGSGLNADELAFIAGLQKAKKQQTSQEQTQKKTKLPGSVGSDEDYGSDDDDDSESGDVSGDQSDSSASGSQEDEAASGSAGSEDVAGYQRSEVKQSSKEDASGEDDDDDEDEDDEESGSGSADDEDDEDESGESSADETQRKDTIIDVASGSGVSFISGVSQSESDEDSSESSGEDDEPEDNMPGSIGQVKGIEKLEQKPPTPAAAAPAFSSGSGATPPSNVKLKAESGSGQPSVTKSQDSFVQPVKDQTKPAPSTGSGEEELPGSVGGIVDIGQLESEAHATADAAENSVSSGSGDSTQSSPKGEISQEESLLQQVLPDASSGSGESYKEEESLPGSIGGQLNLDESQISSNLGSGEEAVQIVHPTANVQHDGSGVATESESAPLVSIAQAADSSGSGSDEQLSGSGGTDEFQSIEIPSSEDESLPGSVGAVGPNLMTMASPENKAGSGMADQSGAGSGSGLQEQANLMKAFQFADSSGSGSGQVEKNENVAKNTIVRMKVSKPAVDSTDKNDTIEKNNETTIIAEKKPANDKEAETGGGFGFGLDSLQPSSGSGLADELLPGGFGNGDSTDLQSLAGSGGEDASGFTFASGSSLMDTGISASGSAYADVASDSGSSSSGVGTLSESDESETLSEKTEAPTASASASASAEQDSGSSSGSGAQALPIVKHTYLPTPKRVGTGISSTTLAASASGSSSSGQSDSGASALPGSVGIEESFSSSGSAVFDTSTTLSEGSASGFIPNIAEFPEEDLLNTEESSASGSEVINVVESGAGEGSGAQASGDDGVEETSQRSHTGKLRTFSFNLNSGLQADAMPDTLARVPINLGVGSSSSYGLGSGNGIDYGSSSDFLSGSAGSGTLELTPATNPSDAIVDLFGNAISNAEKESDSESSSSASLSGEGSAVSHHKKGKNRNRIPVSGDFSDETSLSDEAEEKEQVRFVWIVSVCRECCS